ncbi:hypothetical protein CAI21_09045 [Alkalilimnicola ehrlichii]|uniref:DUF2249 domain-containing protein n=1 Tax=Alkalilimnicola ehrlichii TaxID=351052 RepID=A0A3E0WU81_9GAMM|nr:DUF2249 domain-containing protein [Alkalilimnicola ehrlichii]RFA29954.1 hypothetical protein CAI21_09045 [Alkalilimnicola ehrlichii]RFA36544.1 hypothetical protein CAL65_11320 [Alkalilimnicola ehrlichii]
MPVRVLDVSELEAPEPLERVLRALEELPPGHYLRVLHRREPYLLYPQLDARGFRYRSLPGRQRPVEVMIWHAADSPPERL